MCDVKKTNSNFSVLTLKAGAYITFNACFLIMATGGIGRVYEYTTNSAVATGDGVAAAYRLGAAIKNISCIQFHPTAFNFIPGERPESGTEHPERRRLLSAAGETDELRSLKTRECFLISEAVRGDGAYLINRDGLRFMREYDRRLELAPRDVVSRAVVMESQRIGTDEFYLDISHRNPECIKRRFPGIYSNLLKYGYDLTTDKIPVYPCQHYVMGGINTDRNAQTNIKGLYAVGECAHTGVHGLNRLASNSLLEALVFARIAALCISYETAADTDVYETYEFRIPDNAEPVPVGLRTEIRKIMQESFFVIPDMSAVRKYFTRIEQFMSMFEENEYIINADYVEARSLTTVAYLILKEALLQ
jgi:L-aspartate oxidase